MKTNRNYCRNRLDILTSLQSTSLAVSQKNQAGVEKYESVPFSLVTNKSLTNDFQLFKL